MLIKFKIAGNLCYLSHTETMNMFIRACVRAGLNLRYSRGFNPRPKISLPMPRSVGVEAGNELLVVQIQDEKSDLDIDQFKVNLAERLPNGCDLLDVNVTLSKKSIQPEQLEYLMTIRNEFLDENLKDRIENLMARKTLNIERKVKKTHRFRTIDVRAFLVSVEINGNNIIVQCKVSNTGTIRVDEILRLLELDAHKLSSPVRRTNIKWSSN